MTSGTTEERYEEICRWSQGYSIRHTNKALTILLNPNEPDLLRAEAAHCIGMTNYYFKKETVRGLMTAWKTAPPSVRFYIAYAFAIAGKQARGAIYLLEQSRDDFSYTDPLGWTLAQECRWAITRCRGASQWEDDPDGPAFLSPTWENETQYLRARGRVVRKR
jgi:hypothetical protein